MADIERSLLKLQEDLAKAIERVEIAGDKLMANFSRDSPEWEEYDMANHKQLVAERALAAARGEEHVIPLDFPANWDIGAPLPYLLQNDYRTFLTFFLKDHDPNWDGTYVTVRQPSDGLPSNLAVVEFKNCLAAKMGCPNDEVHNGHPWYGKGLDSYTAQEVVNSKWLEEVQKINSVHRQYQPQLWEGLHHYVLWFHDSTFECLAESFEVELVNSNLSEVLNTICEKLLV